MSDTTPRLGLVKPRGIDSMRTDQHNANMDKLEAVAGAHFMTNAERLALSGANRYPGMYVIETNQNGKYDYYWDGATWIPLSNLPISVCYFAVDTTVPGPINTYQTVKPDTKLLDDFSMYDTSTGLWTIKYKGIYELSGRASIMLNAATGVIGTRFARVAGGALYLVNGERSVVQQGTHLMHTMCKGMAQLNVNDTVKIEYAHGSTGSQGFGGGSSLNTFYVRLVAPVP